MVLKPLVEYFPRDTALIYPFEEDFLNREGDPGDLSSSRPSVRAWTGARPSVFEGLQAGRAVFLPAIH
ncbi:MAG: hypothetical protein R3B47_08920 [Bacteroidia bacterium]